jgi:hypothetical protein
MSNLSAISWQEQVTFWWDDNDVLFVQNQHAELVLDHRNKPVGRHVASLAHIILIPRQPAVFVTPLQCVVSGEATHTNCTVFGIICPKLEYRSTAL